MKSFDGQALFLDRSDINTDEIIPARYLTEITKEALKPHLLEDLNLLGFDPQTDLNDRRVIVARANFGCGSSREHAAWALEVNAINLVIATNFARIFRQNMFNCGMLAIELPEEIIDEIFVRFASKPTQVVTDFTKSVLTLRSGQDELVVTFAIAEFDRALILAGGWVDYADSHY